MFEGAGDSGASDPEASGDRRGDVSAFLSALSIHGVAIGLGLLTILLAGQPIYANDTWIHLALGEVFAAEGPWLAADPHLFAAPGPPAPSSWLGSVAIHGLQSTLGFSGLRAAHGVFVAAILALVWWLGRRFTGSARAASVALVLFIVLSTYRLVQLRPDLFTIAATFAVVHLLVVRREGPGPRSILAAAILSALWANVHAAFLLGPILILGVSASLLAWTLLPGGTTDAADGQRARRLGLAGGAMSIASLLNPMGWRAHAAYFSAGGSTLELTAVADEWARTNPFSLPSPEGFSTWAVWLVVWICLGAILVAGARLIAERRAGVAAERRAVDPALWALAVAGVAAGLLASRFLWMGFFAVLVGCAALLRPMALGIGSRPSRLVPRAAGWGTALVVVAAGWLHLSMGDWVRVSRAFLSEGSDYRVPYYASKFHGHAIWFLADSGVRGRIYNDYPLGGFMSHWLSPELSMSSSGTMNVARDAIAANLAISSGSAPPGDDGSPKLLDRLDVDLFLGTGLPIEAIPGKRGPSTVHYLEGDPDWIPVFRSLRSAVYLRRSARSANNLAKIEAYYAAEGVPFDATVGFDPASVISRSTDWAIDHGLIPVDFEGFIKDLREASRNRAAVVPSLHRLATLYATLGLYDRALDVDRLLLRESRDDLAAAYRQVWCLLRAERFEEALERAEAFDRKSESASNGVGLAANVREVIAASPENRRRLISFLPLFASDQAALAQYGMVLPEARTAR